jgi:hypothetical protein
MTETFKARLQGNPWDLWGLSKLFNGTNADATTVHAKDPVVVQLDLRNLDDREHFAHFGYDTHADLTSNSFRVEFPFNNGDMYHLAMPVLSRINAIGHLPDPEFSPVTLFQCIYKSSHAYYGEGYQHKKLVRLRCTEPSPVRIRCF